MVMRRGIIYSVLFHAVVLTVGYYGMPSLRRLPPAMDAPIVVELVSVAEVTNTPPPEAKPESKPEPKPEPKPAKVEPPPEPAKAEPPPPPPEPEVAAVPPPPEEPPKAKPEPKPKPKPKPKPEAKPKAKPRPKTPPRLAKVKPRRKPRPPDVFASVLKTVEDLKPRPPKPKEKTEKKKKAEESFEAQVAKALRSQARRHDIDRPITISEIDLVRRQIARCWNLQAGAKEAENLIIEIFVDMNPDGTVRHARIQNTDRVAGDPFFRAAAESALRAVLNPRCQPFKLPRDRYDRWQTMALIFDPKEMF